MMGLDEEKLEQEDERKQDDNGDRVNWVGRR